MADYKRKDPTKYKIVIYIITTAMMIFWFFDAQRSAQESVIENVKTVKGIDPIHPPKPASGH